MSIQEEAGLILKLYELRREETMRKARDWYFREFNPQSMADFSAALFGEHSGHLRMVVTYWDMAAAFVTSEAVNKGTVPAKRGRTAVRLAEDQGNHRRRTEGYGQSQVSFQPGDRGVSPD